jgi:fermentation-respiration switch protein FrsA (DUF1100 family)
MADRSGPVRLTLLPQRCVPWKKRLREYALVLPIIYLIWCSAAFMIQDRFIFPRSLSAASAEPGATPRGGESIWIDAGTADKPIKVEAWYIPAPGSSAEYKAPAVVYFHGNAEIIDWCPDRTRGWTQRGYAVLIPEFRGYGRSGGSPSQAGIVADALRFYDLLAARPEIDAARIIMHGRSLGGGVACQLAAARPCAALVLESAFTSVASMSWSMGVPSFLVKHPFHNDRVLAKLDRPVLLLHGQSDTIIPPSHARKLHEISRASMLIEMPGGHNDFPRSWDNYWAAIEAFLSLHKLPSSPERRR